MAESAWDIPYLKVHSFYKQCLHKYLVFLNWQLFQLLLAWKTQFFYSSRSWYRKKLAFAKLISFGPAWVCISGVPKAEVFNRSKNICLFGLWFCPPNFSIAELRLQLNVKNADSVMNWCAVAQLKCKTGENNLKKDWPVVFPKGPSSGNDVGDELFFLGDIQKCYDINSHQLR